MGRARGLSGALPAAARPDARSAFCAGCAAVTTSNWKHAVVLTMNLVDTAACYSS